MEQRADLDQPGLRRNSSSGLVGNPNSTTHRPRSRARSTTINLESSPFETPLTAEEYSLARLIEAVNLQNQREEREEQEEQAKRGLSLPIFQQVSVDLEEFLKAKQAEREAERAALTASLPSFELLPFHGEFSSVQQAEYQAQDHFDKERAIVTKQSEIISTIKRLEGRVRASSMNYQNYLESPAAGPGSNPRQAPPSPSPNMNHANGMNGGAMGIGGMVGFPTPAGHQSDLNYIMSMVEELSRQLEHNQRLTSGVVDKIGKVREKAQNMDLTNDELIALVAAEMNDDTKNLEKECSELRKRLEKSQYDKEENWKLAIHGCNILSDILEKMHKFKEQHETDTLAWHKNYRKQLADEREENLALRNQINDMRAAACRANDWLRKLRRHLTDHDEMHELRVQNIALRQEKRYWKRMALPMLADDDSEFSDDDDIIDPEEKKRQAAEKAEKERKEKEGEGEGGQGQDQIA